VRGLLTLRDWLAAHRVQQVTMEATGVFWNGVFLWLQLKPAKAAPEPFIVWKH
jgi:hypothetical protein